MRKQFRNLWVFGDSYSTPKVCVQPKDSFWMSVARLLGVKNIYNYSWPGNSLDSVIHVLISLSDQFDWDNDVFLVGVPPLVRLTVVSKNDQHSYHNHVYDADCQEIDQQLVLCHHGLENRTFYEDPLAVRFEDPTWTEIQACRSIFLTNQWLDAKHANYLVINLAKDFRDERPATGRFLLEKCLNHPNNILSGPTYYGINHGVYKPVDYDQYGWHGHHGTEGNQHYYEKSLRPKLEKLNLC